MHIAASKCGEIVSLREIGDQTAMMEHCDLQRLRASRTGSSMSSIDISHAELLLKAHGIDNAAVVAGNTASDRIALSACAETGESDRWPNDDPADMRSLAGIGLAAVVAFAAVHKARSVLPMCGDDASSALISLVV